MKWADTPISEAISSLDPRRRIVSIALDGSLAESDTRFSESFFSRGVLWRVFLGLLPFSYDATAMDRATEMWCVTLFETRSWYAGNKQRFLQLYPQYNIPPEDAPNIQEREKDASNLRSSVIGKGTSILECNTSIETDLISLDIRRTFLNNDPEVPHGMLFSLLAVWRWLNPVIGYQQGMHEIAGNCLSMLYRASMSVPDDCPVEVRECLNLNYLEADAFAVFDAVLSTFGLAKFFEASSMVGKGWDSAGRSTPSSLRDSSTFFEKPDLSTLEAACEHIVFDLLKDNSNALYHHLANTNMFDQLLVFLPRWLRNLFTRELNYAQTMVIWDGLFAVFYSEIVNRQTRLDKSIKRPERASLSRRLRSSLLMEDTEEVSVKPLQISLPKVSYAGSPQRQENSSFDTSSSYSRTLAGVAVAILLHIEDDLLALGDDFSLLKRLTSSPIISAETDPVRLMSTAMAVAKSRPSGVVLLTRRSLCMAQMDDEPAARHVAMSTRLTKEDLLLQQRSVAVAIHSVVERMSSRIPQTPNEAFSEDDLRTFQAAFHELRFVADRLSFF
jgi:hypothetical protein